MRPFALLSAALIAAGVLAAPVAAARRDAPQYVASEPEHNSEQRAAPIEVVIRFSEPLDDDSTLVVRNHCGTRIDDDNLRILANEMRIGIAKAHSGEHRATYRAAGLGNITGSTSGTVSYDVGEGPTPSCGGMGDDHGNHGGGGGNGGGGHGGHGGGNGGGGNGDGGGGHGEHDPGTGGGTATGDHDGHDGGSSSAAGGGDHKRHRKGKDQDGGAGDDAPSEVLRQNEAEKEAEERAAELAVGDDPFAAGTGGAAVLAALAASAALGGLGGWMLRITGAR